MQHIASALKNLIKSNGLQKGLDQQRAVDLWPEVVGETINKNSEPVSVENGVLSIKTKNSAWSQELQLQKPQILEKLNKKLDKKIIKDIRFV